MSETGLRYWSLYPLGIALASAFGYSLCYIYDVAYCAYFSIPVDLIAISITNLVEVGVISVALVALVVVALSMMPRPAALNGSFWLMIANGIALTFSGSIPFTGMSAPSPWSAIWGAFCILLGLAGIGFVLYAWIFATKTRTKLPAVFGELAPYGAVLTFLVTSICIAAFAGSMVARKRIMFEVLSTKPPRVVLATFGTNMIAVPFGSNRDSVVPDFKIYVVDSMLPKFEFESVGPLHMR